MSLSTEQLKELENLAYNLIEVPIMAVILECDELTLTDDLRNPCTEEYKAYYRGYGRQLLELRESIIRSAKNGSNPAQEQLMRIMQRFEAQKPKTV